MSRSLLKRLKEMAPAIEWCKPIPVWKSKYEFVDGVLAPKKSVGFLCRICVGGDGFKPADVSKIFPDEEACFKHIETAHVGGKN